MASPFDAFVIIFAVILTVEFFDRTNFTLIGLAARYRRLPIWVGATAAFTVVTLIAVVLGATIGTLLAGYTFYLRLGSGLFILGYAGYLALKKETPEVTRPRRTVVATAFSLIFLLELGDTSMILALNFALTNPAYLVALAAIPALALVAATACLIGHALGARVEPKFLTKVTVGILVVVGVVTILTAFYPGLVPGIPGLGSS